MVRFGLIDFTALYVSGDNRRVHTRLIQDRDIDLATEQAIAQIEDFGGKSSSWFLAGIWQESATMLVNSATEDA